MGSPLLSELDTLESNYVFKKNAQKFALAIYRPLESEKVDLQSVI